MNDSFNVYLINRNTKPVTILLINVNQ